MPIPFQHGIDVTQTSERVFAVLADFPPTPRWLARCTGLLTTVPGPNAVGDALRYSYRDGGRSGVMDGEIVARVPGEHLRMLFKDSMMHVSVDFRMSKQGSGTHLVHTIELTPQT